MANTIIGNEEFYPAYSKKTGVFRATHKQPTSLYETSWLRNNLMERSFISFSYGGKWIEDFNLIATIEGDRLQRQSSANFEHLTTDYDVLDGQFYWGTHYTDNTINFVLATDGMTQQDIDNFKYWFQAGSIRELILAEHPNRAIMARVSAPAGISVLPFEEDTEVMIAGTSYKTKTTLYKGSITLGFSMDEPFWYSKYHMLWKDDETSVSSYQGVLWRDANDQEVEAVSDLDALKIIKEDGIPVKGMITSPLFFGTKVITEFDFTIAGDNSATTTSRDNPVRLGEDGYAVAGASNFDDTSEEAIGIVGQGGDENGYDLQVGDILNLYYPGTAPCKPVIKFSLIPSFTSDYISIPYNKYMTNNVPYNTITFTSIHKKEFKFSLPGVYIGYNQAIDLFKTVEDSISVVDLRKLIRDNITHKHARAWAIAITDYICPEGVQIFTDNLRNKACKLMRYFLSDSNNDAYISSYEFNSKTGRAIGSFTYRFIEETTLPSNDNEWSDWGTIKKVKEDVGDMVKSDYIILEDRNYPSDDGFILPYSDENEKTKSYTYKITSDIDMLGFIIEYKYMYI